jgi:hypothetical protein
VSCTINGALENSRFVPIRNLELIEHKAVEVNSNNFVPIRILHFRRLVPLHFLVHFSALKLSLQRVRFPAKMPFDGLRAAQLSKSIVFRFGESQGPAL